MVESLSGNIPRLVDVLSLLEQRKSERRLVPYSFAAAAGARTPIIGGIGGARIGIISFVLSNSAGGAAAFGLQQGKGNNFGPLIGQPGSDTITLGASGLMVLSVGGSDSPVLIADVGNDVAINNTGATLVIGAGVYVTLETGP